MVSAIEKRKINKWGFSAISWNVRMALITPVGQLILNRREKQHNRGIGSKYTRMHRPVKLVYIEEMSDRSTAMKREGRLNIKAGTETRLIHT